MLDPEHDCAAPHCSPETQPHVPPLQMPLAQSEFRAHGGAAPHVPPQMLPAPQSALDAHALAEHLVLLHRPVGPQSVLTAQAAGGVHVEPVQVLPLAQLESPLQGTLQRAELQRPVTEQSPSTWQVVLVHFPAHALLTEQSLFWPQLAVAHLAPLHKFEMLQSLSP